MEEAGKRLTGVFKRPSPRQKSSPARAPTPDVAPSSSEDEDDDTSDLEAKVRAAMARNDSDESVDELDYAPREEVVEPPTKRPGDELKDTLDAFVVATEDLCMRLSSHERRGVEAQRERQALAEERASSMQP